MSDETLSKLRIDKGAISERGTSRKKRIVITGVLILLVLFSILYISGIIVRRTAVRVTVVRKIYPSQSITVLNASGYVVAQRKAAVASKITGRIISISVEEGNEVRKGDVLARLENEDAVAAARQATANLELARAEREKAKAELHDALLSRNRKKELLQNELVSQGDYDAADARYKKAVAGLASADAAIKAAEAALRSAEVTVEYANIRAPFDAVVLTKNADIGDIVTPIGAAAEAKAAVVTIAAMNSLQAEVDVSESSLTYVKVGQPCEIYLDALPDTRFQGVVHMIVPTADRTRASVLVKVKFLEEDSRILPEMSAKVAFLERPLNPKEFMSRIAVHEKSVVKRNGKTIVFLVTENYAEERPIKTGDVFDEMVEILDGLSVGDKIVLQPPESLKDGTKIAIIEE
ncbi:MAG: efflux RND transporter periplasmic adaptor subunit [Nitrospiraceae bacterium]|nr:MAG: efflux RND transporter periplasmic adaptor subunit [Nitrospiraceae bacterium]